MEATNTEQTKAAAQDTVQAAAPTKVMIKLLRDAQVGPNNIQKAGWSGPVDKETADELCDKSFDGYIPAYGTLPEIGPLTAHVPGMENMPNPLARHMITRAVRI